MLLTINCEGPDAMDLSWLLHKRPNRFQAFNLGYGKAFVFFTEYSQNSCTACLLLEIMPDALNDLCKSKDGEFQYVNSRQYLSSSLLAGAIGKAYSSAIKGTCQDKPDLVGKKHGFKVRINNFSCRLNPIFIDRIFSPLGYQIEWRNIQINDEYCTGGFICGDLQLSIDATLQEILSHLYILLPVFDRQTHFWLDESQLQKFIRHCQGWLGRHPEKRLIINEYFGPVSELKYRLMKHFGVIRPLADKSRTPTFNQMRRSAISDVIAASGAKTIIDLGCGDGSFVFSLHGQNRYEKLAGMDASAQNIENARKKFDSPFFHRRKSPEFFIGSITYRDKRISGYDAVILSEVIEHFEPERMDGVMRNILGEARPKLFVMTTPNKAYNQEFPFLEAGEFRHPDHRHEFGEDEFISFCEKYAAVFGYDLEISHVGVELSRIGSPTFMGIFKKCA